MTITTFRKTAKDHLLLAEKELNSGKPERVFYAALELRKAIEAITYDKAHAYKNDLPLETIETWQPKKVMELLLEIDPHADKGGTISFAPEDGKGNLKGPFKELGTENVFSLKDIKKNYDALGNFLHTPSIKQVNLGKTHDEKKIKIRCKKIHKELGKVLSSTMWNSTFGPSSTLKCLRCSKPIRRRLNTLKIGDKTSVKCFFCQADYEIEILKDQEVNWTPIQVDITCPKEDCKNEMLVWPDKIQIGNHFKCGKCGESLEFCLVVGMKKNKPPKKTP